MIDTYTISASVSLSVSLYGQTFCHGGRVVLGKPPVLERPTNLD